MIEKLLTTKQLSERFGVTGQTIYNWRQEGKEIGGEQIEQSTEKMPDVWRKSWLETS